VSLPLPEDVSAADRQLVAACLSGGTAAQPAWERLVDRFHGLVKHVVARTAERRRIPISSADRDDLVADVFVEILQRDAAALRGYAGRSSLATYLTVISRRVACRRLNDVARPVLTATAAAAEPPAEPRIDTRDQVASLLEGLEADEARLVRLFYIEERSYGEISRLLGIPVGSVGPALSKARAKIRRHAG
jgi:RNA polymerase sigma-70 factor (ECF subfamily)